MRRIKVFLFTALFSAMLGGFFGYYLTTVKAAQKTITSRIDFEKGEFNQTEANFKEGELKLKPAGYWGASNWRTPNQSLSNGSALVSDNNYTYVLAEWNLYFARYRYADNTWEELARPPYNPGGGGDMVVLGDYIYTIFGNKSKQRYFARYSKSANSWEVLPETIDKMSDGASLTTDGTYIYCTRGGGTTDFWKYDPTARTWSVLNNAIFSISSGANLVYKSGNIYTPRGGNSNVMMRYSMTTDLWTTLAPAAINFNENHNIDLVGDYMYITRDGGTQEFYRYQLPDLTIVGGVRIDSVGSNYTAGNLIVDNTGTGGSGFAGTYTVAANGSINGITVTSIGYSYASMPRVYPQATVRSVGISVAGVNYVAGNLIVDNTGTGGSGFAGTYTVSASGAVNGITVTNYGAGYTSMPVVRPRKAVYSVGITNGGSGYTAGALVVDNTGTGGSGFAGTYTVSGGRVNSITITNNGDGYNSPPVISPQPGGSGAVLTPVMGSGAVLLPSGGNGAALTALDNHGGWWTRLADLPQTSRYLGSTYNAAENKIYVFRGNGYYDFWKYDIAQNNFLEPKENFDTFGSGSDLIYNNGYLYAPRGQNTSPFYRYSISGNTWVAMPSLPTRGTDPSPQATLNTSVRGVGVGSYIYFMRGNSGATGTSQQTFVRFNTVNSTWEYLADTPLYVAAGGALVNVNVGGTDYIYATAGEYRVNFWRYRIDTNTWENMPNVRESIRPYTGAAMVSDGTNIYMMAGYGQSVLGKFNIGTTTWSELGVMPFASYWGSDMAYFNGKIYAQAGYYKKDVWEYTIATNTWRRLKDLDGYGPLNYGPNSGGSLEVDDQGNLWSIYGGGLRNIQKYTLASDNYVNNGSWTSEQFDLNYVESYGQFISNYTLPPGASITFESRTSSDKVSWSNWQVINGGNIASAVARYIQFKVTLGAGTSNVTTPKLFDLSFSYTGDTEAPSNPNSFEGKSQQVSGVGLTNSGSYRYFAPYFSWSGASDNNKSGIAGYYVYFGRGETANPETEGTYQTMSNYTVSDNMVNGERYYLRIKTKDIAGNISSAVTGFTYVYTGVDPASFEVETNEVFGLGTTSNITIANNSITLKQKDNGFWVEETMRGTPAPYYGSNLVYLKNLQKMYLTRGSDTRDFWEYDMPTNTWLNKGTLPDTVYYYGANLVEGPSGFLYALRGKSSRSFWRYEIATNTWSDAAARDFPVTVSLGTDLIFDGEKYIYATVGNSSSLFYRYDTSLDIWEKMADTDFGAIEKQSNNLISGVLGPLAYDGGDNIYTLKGGSTSGFAVYSIDNDTWTVLPDLPDVPNSSARITYEQSTNSIYYQSGYSFFFRFDIDSQTWSQLDDLPYTAASGSCLVTVEDKLYWIRGSGDNRTGIFDVKAQKWNTPPRGLFNEFWKGQELISQSWGSAMVKGDGQNYYITNGNFSDDFAKYNPVTGERTRLADIPQGNYHMGKMVYLPDKNKIMMTSSYYYRGGNWFTYDLTSDTWTVNTGDTMPWSNSTYSGHNLVYDGSQYVYAMRGQGYADVWRYDTNGIEGSRWKRVANAPNSLDWGAYLVKKDNYIYTLRGSGSNPNPLYRMDLGTTAWTTLPSLPGRVYQGGWLADGGDGYLYATRGENTNEMYRYNIGTSTWSNITNYKSPVIASAGGEVVFNGSDRLYVLPGSTTDGTWNTGIYTYVIKTEDTAFEKEGEYISAVHDLGKVYRLANLTVGYTGADNFNIALYTKTSVDNVNWGDWELSTLDKSMTDRKIYKINSAGGRYIKVKIELSSLDGVYSGIINNYQINYYQDSSAPTNPTSLTAYSGVGSSQTLTTNIWNKYEIPVFDWPDKEETNGATDGLSGSGVKGYYIYFGVGETADPAVSGSLVTLSEYTAPTMVSGKTYYLRIKTVDEADNVSENVWEPFVYKFDNVKPVNPTTIVADPPGYSTTNSYTFNWNEATDSSSLIKDYCYKTAAVGATEVCTSEKIVTGIPSYQAGSNTFYVRARDYAGNFANDYITATYYYSANAPSGPKNLRVTPESNSVNEFAFSWEPPEFYFGAQTGLRYYYSINALPTEDNVNDIGLANAYLSAGQYATQKGVNSFYVVAKDEAGNIDYDLYSKVDFTAVTSAPGIPRNVDISDVSVKETSNWRLATAWESPEASGSGIATYKIYRSKTSGADCSTNMDNFRLVSSTTSESFVDTNLSQVKHYYCVVACDSTNECSAPSSTVSLLPDGKWRVPPTLIGEPEVTVKTKSALVNWSTNRTSSSFVKYGKSSGAYGDEVGTSEQVAAHVISLTGLDPGTTYYYKTLWTDEDGNTGESEEGSFTTNPAPMISTVKISDVSLYSAYVTFTLKSATRATIQYGKTTSYGETLELSTSTAENQNSVKLETLDQGTKYHLRIQAYDEEDNVFTSDDYIFETLPLPKLSNIKIQQVKGMPTATLRLLWQSNTSISSIVTYYPTAKPEMVKDQIKLTLVKNHEIILNDLEDDTEYTLVIKGKDKMSNGAEAVIQKMKTSADMRSPTISNINIETVVSGVGDEAKAQVIVSWDTDEPATSQVEYGQGTGSDYPNKTQKDSNLTLNHSVTISDLEPTQVYHMRIITEDKMTNGSQSYDNVVITPKETSSALNLVIQNLSKSFGFISNFGTMK
ncbi:MAG: fibronectin type III domain-containing protein [Candidatus Shapirobacteria bacterium]|nr:fibronectin type III domain-containing protein [Candidatus Shapirobacteria bacterium]